MKARVLPLVAVVATSLAAFACSKRPREDPDRMPLILTERDRTATPLPAPEPEPETPPPVAATRPARPMPASAWAGDADSLACRVAVGAVQAELVREGARIDVDGSWGPRTEAAVRELQRDRELPATGLPDGILLEALFGGDSPEIRRTSGRSAPPVAAAAATDERSIAVAAAAAAGVIVGTFAMAFRRG